MRKKILTRICIWFLFALSVLCSVATVSAVVADPVKLGWNAASDASVKGYVIYYGATNQPATNRIVAGTNLTVTLNALQANVTYKIYAASYNAAGIESVPSNLVTLMATVVPKLNITRQTNGNMTLDYRMTAGAVCAVQYSATLKPGSWRTLTNVTANLAGVIIATDASASRVKQRFYRIAHSAQPLISAMDIVKLTNSIRLTFVTPPLANCAIQYVTKPTSTNWTLLAHLTADAEGTVTYVEPANLAASGRFYRAVLE